MKRSGAGEILMIMVCYRVISMTQPGYQPLGICSATAVVLAYIPRGGVYLREGSEAHQMNRHCPTEPDETK